GQEPARGSVLALPARGRALQPGEERARQGPVPPVETVRQGQERPRAGAGLPRPADGQAVRRQRIPEARGQGKGAVRDFSEEETHLPYFFLASGAALATLGMRGPGAGNAPVGPRSTWLFGPGPILFRV